MLGVLKRKRNARLQAPADRVSFGSLPRGDFLKLRQGLGELRRHIPRFIVARESGLKVFRTIEEYERIEHALEAFDDWWGEEESRLDTEEAEIVIRLESGVGSGFALALVELVLICQAVSTNEKMMIADIANSLLKNYTKEFNE
jgi:hypothetical protein